ncbi:mechanosensitive ion channel family protein [Candidatus Uabimicrobium sp. HlEnr_7]|uniref:mechanosensitive ion channel family protein n=1 Tax=Candidatus Uabimicrobium helgolandensis TaxID=3095367 RepID=UPI003557018D
MYLLENTWQLDWQQVLAYAKKIALEYGPNILLSLTVLVLGRMVSGILRKISMRVMKKANTDASIQSFVSSLVYITSMIFVVIASLNILGIPTASFVAVVGAAGLAIGLAFQGALSNFAAGFLIIVFKPYKIGDFIEGGGESGSVKSIQLFTTTLTTTDNKTIIIPNSQMTNGNITNYSTEEKRRIDLVVGIGYDDDIDHAKKILTQITKQNSSVLKEPETIIAVVELADSSVNFVVRPWVKTADYWPTYFKLQETIKKELDKEGISIPYPQRDVHIYEHKTESKKA